MSCGASRNNNNTLLTGCKDHETTLDGHTTHPVHDSTTLTVCHHNHPSTTLAHSSAADARAACKKWCGDDFAEKCENTTIELGEDNHYHWSVPEGCTIQCPATGASSR